VNQNLYRIKGCVVGVSSGTVHASGLLMDRGAPSVTYVCASCARMYVMPGMPCESAHLFPASLDLR
jgi:hypothetical protein